MPVLAPERLVKCPTEHCPGWITVEDARPQTVPCRYCRVTAHTLAYLLGQISDQSVQSSFIDLWSPALHERFNNLLLQLAGSANTNVYIRPMDRALVARVPGQHGQALEYNPEVAAVVGATPMVALFLHELLHFDLHKDDDRPLQIGLKQNARDKEYLGGPLRYLFVVADHLWLYPRLDEAAPGLLASLEEWGLDIALMLSGGESFFLPYIDERNRRWLVETVQQRISTPEPLREALVERLAELTVRFFGQERELLRRTLLASEIADIRLRNGATADAYIAHLRRLEMPGIDEAATMGQRMYEELLEVRSSSPAQPTATDFRRAVEASLRALQLQNVAEVFGQKK